MGQFTITLAKKREKVHRLVLQSWDGKRCYVVVILALVSYTLLEFIRFGSVGRFRYDFVHSKLSFCNCHLKKLQYVLMFFVKNHIILDTYHVHAKKLSWKKWWKLCLTMDLYPSVLVFWKIEFETFSKNQVQTWFLVYFELGFYCLCIQKFFWSLLRNEI